MKIPINTTEDNAFAIRTGYERHAYCNGVTRGGILSGYCGSGGLCKAIGHHQSKDGWSNIFPDTNSQVKSTAILEIYESNNA